MPHNKKREVRNAGTSTVAGNTLTGYIALFNTLSGDLGGFQEKLAPGCFKNALRSNDIRALINHNKDLIIGRTGAGTLQLIEDEKGLAFSCDLPDTQAARDLKVSVERKDLTGNSFGFVCNEEQWNGNIRTVLDAGLFEVSTGVTWPAYEATSVALREMFPDGQITPPSTQQNCSCTCSQCMAGSCGICSNDDCDDDVCSDGGCTNQDVEDDDADDSDNEFNSSKALENVETRTADDDAEWKANMELRLRLAKAKTIR